MSGVMSLDHMILGNDMRLGLVALSAVLLSGCSWLGGAKPYTNPYAKQAAATYGATNPCQIMSPQQPIPKGCRPEQVTLGLRGQGAHQGGYAQGPNMAGGFAQTPQFGQPQHTTGQYGSHAGQAKAHAGAQKTGPNLRKPKFRGTLSAGFEKSVSGSALDYNVFTTTDGAGNVVPFGPAGAYNPQTYREGRITSGNTTDGTSEYFIGVDRETALGDLLTATTVDGVDAPTISLSDAWSTPFSVKGGGEYILNKKTTVFGNVGYTASQGEELEAATVNATVMQVNTQTVAGVETIQGATFIPPQQQIAQFAYDFSDMRRIDLEVGARRYFNPIAKDSGSRTITPFVSASAGASHYSGVDVKVTQRQGSYEALFDNPQVNGVVDQAAFYGVDNDTAVSLYDSQWVPQGQLNAGMEWQVTPKSALAVETGLRIEGAREYSNGVKGDTNVSIPVTLRGSFNF